MTNIALKKLDVSDLNIFISRADLRRDLQVYLDYIGSNSVTRTYRNNSLPKTHARRLAKLCGDPSARDEIEDGGSSSWLNFLDGMAFNLELVKYDTEGVYAGYNSTAPSYPDNDIEIDEQKLTEFNQMFSQERESLLLSSLVNEYDYDANEFLEKGAFSCLDRYSFYGCRCGVMPHIHFAQARKALFAILAQCEPGTWYSTASLIEYMKTEHRYFLIPEKLPAGIHESERYNNFLERLDRDKYDNTKIETTDPLAYERVEGRYIERFLEGIPLEMGYLDIAYTKDPQGKLSPSIGCLKAFRVRPCFLPAWRKEIQEPIVTVLPNFEVHIESLVYPYRVLGLLKPMCDIISEDVHTVLRLKKQKVAYVQAENSDFQAIQQLEELSSKPLPSNIRQELDAWCGHANKFTLYKGFALFEGNVDLEEVQYHLAEQISPTEALITKPEDLYAKLERAETIPIYVKHRKNVLSKVPKGSASLFAAKKTKATPKKKEVIKRSTMTTLTFPSPELFDAFLKLLLDGGIVSPHDKSHLSFTYFDEQVKKITPVLKQFGKNYNVRVSG